MLESAGSSLDRVVRVQVVLADISHMAEMDRVYREFFPVDPPARTAWSMQLRFGNGCEIECVALAGWCVPHGPVEIHGLNRCFTSDDSFAATNAFAEQDFETKNSKLRLVPLTPSREF